jgi:hypothetical protein
MVAPVRSQASVVDRAVLECAGMPRPKRTRKLSARREKPVSAGWRLLTRGSAARIGDRWVQLPALNVEEPAMLEVEVVERGTRKGNGPSLLFVHGAWHAACGISGSACKQRRLHRSQVGRRGTLGRCIG